MNGRDDILNRDSVLNDKILAEWDAMRGNTRAIANQGYGDWTYDPEDIGEALAHENRSDYPEPPMAYAGNENVMPTGEAQTSQQKQPGWKGGFNAAEVSERIMADEEGGETNLPELIDGGRTDLGQEIRELHEKARDTSLYAQYMYSREDWAEKSKEIFDETGMDLDPFENKDVFEKAWNLTKEVKRQKALATDASGHVDMDKVCDAIPGFRDIQEAHGTAAAVMVMQSMKELQTINDIYQGEGERFAASVGYGIKRGGLQLVNQYVGAKAMFRGLFSNEGLNAQEINDILWVTNELRKMPQFSYSSAGSLLGGVLGSAAENAPIMLPEMARSAAAHVGKLTGPVGTAASAFVYALMSAQIGGAQYIENITKTDENGNPIYTPRQAALLSAAQGLAEGYLEKRSIAAAGKAVFNAGTAKRIAEIYAKKDAALAAGQTAEELTRQIIGERIRHAAKAGFISIAAESEEEFEQQVSDMVLENIAQIAVRGDKADVSSMEDILAESFNAAVQAVPATVGFGLIGAGGSVVANTKELNKQILSARERFENAQASQYARNIYENERRNAITADVRAATPEKLEKSAPDVYTEILDRKNEAENFVYTQVDLRSLMADENNKELVDTVIKLSGATEEEVQECLRPDSSGMLNVKTSSLQRAQSITPEQQQVLNQHTAHNGKKTNYQIIEEAKRIRESLKAVEAKTDEEKKAAIENFAKGTFADDEATQKLAIEAISENPDNPALVVRSRMKANDEAISEILGPTIEGLKAESGQGTSVVETLDKNGDVQTGRASNNPVWYQNFYADYGRAPTNADYERIAYENATGTATRYSTGEIGNLTPEDVAYFEATKAELDALFAERESLRKINAALDNVRAGEFLATASLSAEGREAYNELIGALGTVDNKKVRQAARAGAIFAARMAERVAQMWRDAGEKKTAKDVMPQVLEKLGAQVQDQSAQNQVDEAEIRRQLAARDELLASAPVASIKNDELDIPAGKEQRNKAKEIFKKLYPNKGFTPYETTNKYGERIFIPSSAFGELKDHSADKNLLRIVPHIEAILKDSTYLFEAPPEEEKKKAKDKDTKGYRYYGCKIRMDGEEYYVRSVVRVANDGRLYYDGDLTSADIIEKALQGDAPDTKPGSALKGFSKHSIADWLKKVNEYERLNNTLPQFADANAETSSEIAKEADALYDGYIGEHPDVAEEKMVSRLLHDAFQMTLDFGADPKTDIIVEGQTSLFDEEGNVIEQEGKPKKKKRSKKNKDAKRGKILGLGITRELVNEGVVSLEGKKVRSTRDLAEIAQVLRHPGYEKFHVVYVDANDNVIFHSTVSCRLPGQTTIFTKGEEWSDAWQRIFEDRDKHKAAKFYFIHNHPSGDPTPSQDDINLTKHFIEGDKRYSKDYAPMYKRGFAGHIIIDHNKYSVIDRNGKVRLDERIKKDKAPSYDVAEIPHDALYQGEEGLENATSAEVEARINENQVRKINNPDNLEAIINLTASDAETTAFFLTQRLTVRAVQKIHDDFGKLSPKAMLRYLRYCARETSGARCAIATSNYELFEKLRDIIMDTPEEGIVDVVYMVNGRASSHAFDESAKHDSAHETWFGRPLQQAAERLLEVPEEFARQRRNENGNMGQANRDEGHAGENNAAENFFVERANRPNAFARVNDNMLLDEVFERLLRTENKSLSSAVKLYEKSVGTANEDTAYKGLLEAVKVIDQRRKSYENGAVIEALGEILRQRITIREGSTLEKDLSGDFLGRLGNIQRGTSGERLIPGEYGQIERATKERRDLFDKIRTEIRNREDRARQEANQNNGQVNESRTDYQGGFSNAQNLADVLNQTDSRGTYSRRDNLIALFQNADQSTFMHEMSHFYLNQLAQIAAISPPDSQAAKDYATAKAWAEWHEGDAEAFKGTAAEEEFAYYEEKIKEAEKNGSAVMKDGTTRTKGQLLDMWEQEKFARGFEDYLRSGNAPSSLLQKIFRSFVNWLTKIYKDVVGVGVKPSAEVEAVMARMVATDEEIEMLATIRAAESVANIAPELLDENTAAMHARWSEEAKEEAKEKLRKELLKEWTERDVDAHMKDFEEMEAERLQSDPAFETELLVSEGGVSEEDAAKATGYGSIEAWKKDLEEKGGSYEAALAKSLKVERDRFQREMIKDDALIELAEEAIVSTEYAERLAVLEAEAIKRREKKYATAPKRLANALAKMETALDTENLYDPLKAAFRELKYAERWNEAQQKQIEEMQATIDELTEEKQELRNMASRQSLRNSEERKEAAEKAEADKEKLKARNEKSKAKLREKLKAQLQVFKDATAKNAEWLRGVRDAVKGNEKLYRQIAKDQLDNMSAADATNWRKYMEEARKASKESARHLANAVRKQNGTDKEDNGERDFELARQAKMREALFIAQAREAAKRKKELSRIVAHMKRREKALAKDKNIDASSRYYVNHLLYMMGFRKSDALVPMTLEGFSQHMNALKDRWSGEKGENNIGDLDVDFEVPSWLASMVESRNGMRQKLIPEKYTDYKMSEIEDLKTLVDILYKTARNRNRLLTMEKNIVEAVQEIMLDYQTTVTVEKGEEGISEFYSELLQPIVMLRTLGKAFVKYIYNPLFDGTEARTRMSMEAAETLNALFAKYWNKKERRAIRKKELDAELPDGTKLTKEMVLALALNWGNDGNRLRVLNGWTKEGQYYANEGTIEDIFRKYMTEKDWAFIQEAWDFINTFGDKVNEVMERSTGAPMKRVEPRSFVIKTADGEFVEVRGGYYPIAYDPTKSTAVSEQDLMTSSKAIGGASTFSTGMSSTKARSETGLQESPLLLSIDVLFRHVNQQIHIATMRLACRDAYKILTDPSVKAMIEQSIGMNAYRQLKRWVEANWQEPRMDGTIVDKWIERLRRNTVAAIMGYRMSTALLNLANPIYMAREMGALNALSSFVNFYRNRAANRAWCLEQSPFLRNRANNIDRDLNNTAKNSFAPSNPLEDVIQRTANRAIEETDMLCSLPAYYGTYQRTLNAELEKGAKPEDAEKEAHRAAEDVVRRIFGSSDTLDQSFIQRHKSALTKAFTPFYTFAATQANAVFDRYMKARYQGSERTMKDNGHIEIVKKGIFSRYGAMVNAAVLTYILGTLAEQLLRECINKATGDDDKDKLTPEEFAKRWAAQSLSGFTSGVPGLNIVGDFVGVKITGETYPTRNFGIASAAIDRGTEAFNAALKFAEGKRDWIDTGRTIAKGAGAYYGFPDTLTDAVFNAARALDIDASFQEWFMKSLFDRKLKAKKGR